MRITGGKRLGHRIQVPAVSDLRPSQDIVREAVFQILGDVRNLTVLDIYAGTGAMGLEALSRGAKFCDFVEHEPNACQTIQTNLRGAGLEDTADIYCEEAEKFATEEHPQKYNLVFLDPPYAARPRSVIRNLPGLLSDKGTIVYLHNQRIVLDENPDREWIADRLQVADKRRYGATHVSFLKKREVRGEK